LALGGRASLCAGCFGMAKCGSDRVAIAAARLVRRGCSGTRHHARRTNSTRRASTRQSRCAVADGAAGGRAIERVFFVPFGTLPTNVVVDSTRLAGGAQEIGSQRVDVLCRCIVAALLCSKRLRRDSTLVAAFAKPSWTRHVGDAFQRSFEGKVPDEAGMTGVVNVLGTELQNLEEEEQWVSTTLAQLLRVTRDAHECVRSSSSTDSARLAGWHWSSVVSLKQVLERLLAPSKVIGRPAKQEQPIPRLFLLSEDADATAQEALEEARADGAQQLVFVLGDHKGFGRGPVETLVSAWGAKEVTLGPTPLLTSQCITVLNWEMDKLWPPDLSDPLPH